MVMELEKIAKLYELKNIYRDINIENRFESTAEHCWSMLILSRYLTKIYKYNFDEDKIFKMIMYHDLAEIELGDIPLGDSEGRKDKKAREEEALKELLKNIPDILKAEISEIIEEYNKRESIESKFVKAVDYMDAAITSYKYNFRYKDTSYTPEMLIEYAKKNLKDFPEILEFFMEVLSAKKEKGLFD
jgi:putative hydrolases of HD superfamily